MKKIILLLLLVLVSVTASARKSYITVYAPFATGYAPADEVIYSDSRYIFLTGDVPDNIEGFNYQPDYHCWKSNNNYNSHVLKYSTGEILNVFSEYGYEVEFIETQSNDYKYYLLSKEIPDGQTISKGDVNIDGEVNISDVNEVISLILGYVREHPEILEQIKKQTSH